MVCFFPSFYDGLCFKIASNLISISKRWFVSTLHQSCYWESPIDVFEVMKMQTGKNYKSIFDNMKEERGDVIYKTSKLNKWWQTLNWLLQRNLQPEVYPNPQWYPDIYMTVSVISTLQPLCWLTIFDFKVWPWSFNGDNSVFGFKEIEISAKYYLEHNLFIPVKAEAMPQEWHFLRSCMMHICTQPIRDVYGDLLLESDEEIQNILVLIQLMATISPSTAACECGFQAINREKTSLHTSRKDDRLEDILQICVNGELLEKFDSWRFLEMWLSLSKNPTSEDRLTGPRGPNKKSNVNNEDELDAQIMDELVPLET